MSNEHRPEIGRGEGVKAWSEGEPYCTIVCTNGHKKRTIERVRWAGENAQTLHLYTNGFRLEDPFGVDPGTSVEARPGDDDFKTRLRCPTCRVDVVLNNSRLEQLAQWVRDASVPRLELTRLAAILSK